MGVIMGANIGYNSYRMVGIFCRVGGIFKPGENCADCSKIGVIDYVDRKEKILWAKDCEHYRRIWSLFIGISSMSSAVAPLQESEGFVNLFVTLGRNPILGILAGTFNRSDPELFGFGRNFAESGSSRTGSF